MLPNIVRITSLFYLNSEDPPVINKPTIKPNNPMTEAKISITNILINKDEFDASLIAAIDPTIPTTTPHIKLVNPTVIPPQNNEYAVKKLVFENLFKFETSFILDEKMIDEIKP